LHYQQKDFVSLFWVHFSAQRNQELLPNSIAQMIVKLIRGDKSKGRKFQLVMVNDGSNNRSAGKNPDCKWFLGSRIAHDFGVYTDMLRVNDTENVKRNQTFPDL